MVAILLTTDTFRGNTTVSRCAIQHAAWLAVPLYWIHQFEEYSLPCWLRLLIQEMICEKIGFPPYPDCPIPLAFYPCEHRSHVFGAAAAYLFRRNVLISLSFWDCCSPTACAHGLDRCGAYNTGLWSAAFLFVPLSIGHLCVRDSRPYSGKVVAWPTPLAVTHALLFSATRFTRPECSAMQAFCLCRRDLSRQSSCGDCEPILQA